MPPLLKLLRPHQWSKNLFVFAGLIFAHAWQNFFLVSQAIMAAATFTLTASSMYIFNDLLDRKTDRDHPVKKDRPLAAGTFNTMPAIAWALGLLSLALIFSFIFTAKVGWILLAYVGISAIYSGFLKHVILIDVFVIAAGFLLRVLAGTTGIGIPPSNWLLLCTLLLTLFLGFCKRRAEQSIKPSYSRTLLDKLISITATGSIICYMFYTLYQDNLFNHGAARLIYTVPLVIYGLFRYLYLLDNDHFHYIGSDIARDIVRDRHLLIVILVWLSMIIMLPKIH
jgi:4-hydroxybenzoate polyprenyltransferase